MKSITIGTTYGRWTVVGEKIRRNNRTFIPCKCACGAEKEVEFQNLKSGISTSCGCFRKELRQKRMLVHGEKYTRLYETWIKMRARCNNPNDIRYKSYGGRGIKVCDEWERSYIAFRDWANANGYNENLTWKECSIDRIDNNKGYSPDNCRWTDINTQARNRRNTILIEYDGKTQTATEWSRELGISRQTICSRYKRGLSAKDILFVGNLKER